MPKSAPFFPFYVDDWLEDEAIFDMGLECEGAYIRLLSAMWKRNGLVPDKERWCCNILRCKPAKWRKIRATLLELEVLKIDNNSLFNERLMKELNVFNEKCEKNEENANKRWKKSVETDHKKPNKINESIHATALRPECHTDTDTDTDTELLNNMSKKTFSDDDMGAANYIFDRLKDLNPSFKKPNLDSWANSIRLMVERDKHSHREICALFKWANLDSFWKSNILSPDKLRKQWDQLILKRGSENDRPTKSNRPLTMIERVEKLNTPKQDQDAFASFDNDFIDGDFNVE